VVSDKWVQGFALLNRISNSVHYKTGRAISPLITHAALPDRIVNQRVGLGALILDSSNEFHAA
jgi:hypothetical protein